MRSSRALRCARPDRPLVRAASLNLPCTAACRARGKLQSAFPMWDIQLDN